MNKQFKLVLLTILVGLFLASNLLANNGATPQLPLEYFVKLSDARSVKISPDGKHLVVIYKKDGRDLFAILDSQTMNPISAIGVRGSGGSVGQVFWANNERLVYTVTKSSGSNKTTYSTGELFGVNVDGSKHTIIFGYRSGEKQTGTRLKKKKADYGNHEIIDYLEGDERHILISFYPWKLFGNVWRQNPTAIPTIQKLNIYSGKMKKVGYLPSAGARAITDSEGAVRFSVAVDKNNERVIHYKKNNESEWELFSLDTLTGSSFQPVRFSKDDGRIYFSADVDGGTNALYSLNLKDKSIVKIFHDEKVDIANYMFDFSRRQIVAVYTQLNLPKYHYIDKSDPKAKLHQQLMQAFAGSDVVLTSATSDGGKMIAFVYSGNNPGDYYLFDTKTLAADYIISQSSWVDPNHLSTIEPIEYVTRDEVTIHGYLTRPKNSQGKKLPTVVLPHGGPHGVRDYWQYDWEVQLLANRGYAVLQVNFRGSGGFGETHLKAGYGKWGTLMQDDITDATRWLVKQGIADPRRICIYGTSYGGYAALMGSVREPDLYQCAIGSAGVYDLPMLYEEGDIAKYSLSGVAFLKDAVGENKEDLRSRSPVHNVKKIKANLLIVHGARDERAPIEQAESLKDALDKVNKPYEWLEMGNEGHGYYDVNNRIKVYAKILEFLDKNIGKNSTSQASGK